MIVCNHDIQTNLKPEAVILKVKKKNYLECELSHQQNNPVAEIIKGSYDQCTCKLNLMHVRHKNNLFVKDALCTLD